MLFQIADLILILHFGIVLFITSLFFLIPVGYKFNWIFTKNIKVRVFHAGLMTFVTIETFLGMACPLTYLENYFLNENENENKLFLSYWLNKIIYWDLPSYFFLIMYLICLVWTFIMWYIFPPKKAI